MFWESLYSYHSVLSNFIDISSSGKRIATSRIKIHLALDNDAIYTTFLADFDWHLDLSKLIKNGRNREKNMLEKRLWENLSKSNPEMDNPELDRILNAVLNRVRTYWLWIALNRKKSSSPKKSHLREDTYIEWSGMEDWILDNDSDFIQ